MLNVVSFATKNMQLPIFIYSLKIVQYFCHHFSLFFKIFISINVSYHFLVIFCFYLFTSFEDICNSEITRYRELYTRKFALQKMPFLYFQLHFFLRMFFFVCFLEFLQRLKRQENKQKGRREQICLFITCPKNALTWIQPLCLLPLVMLYQLKFTQIRIQTSPNVSVSLSTYIILPRIYFFSMFCILVNSAQVFSMTRIILLPFFYLYEYQDILLFHGLSEDYR